MKYNLFVFYIYLFSTLIVFNQNVLLIDAQIPQPEAVVLPIKSIIKGVESYANSAGTCSFSFFIKGPITLTTGSIKKECIITSSYSTQSLCVADGVYSNTTNFGIKGTIGFSSLNPDTYTNIKITVTKTFDSSTATFLLINQDGTPFNFKCENVPVTNAIFDSVIEPSILINSQVYLSNYFRGSLKIRDEYTRPISTSFVCTSSDYSCTFIYADKNKLAFVINFQDTFINSGLGAINIKNSEDNNLYTIRNPLDNPTATLTITTFEFKLAPFWGYYLEASLSSLDQFPPTNLNLEPLFGTSIKDLKFFYRGVSTTPRVIDGNGQVTNPFPTIPTPISSNLVITTPPPFVDTQYKFLDIDFDTNSRFSTTPSDILHYAYYPYGLISYNGYTRHYRFPVIFNQFLEDFIFNVKVPDENLLFHSFVPSVYDQVPPVLDSLELILLNDTHSVLRIGASDTQSGVSMIYYATTDPAITKNNLVSGTKLSGVYELIVPLKKSFATYIEVIDYAGLSTLYQNEQLNFMFDIELFQGTSYLLSDFTSFYFSSNQVDVKNSDADFVIYANISQTLIQRKEYTSILIEVFYSTTNKPKVVGVYNETSQLYEFKFRVPAQMTPGILTYSIVINNQEKIGSYYVIAKFGQAASLMIENTGIIDVSFPIVTSLGISPLAGEPVAWSLEINDINIIKTVIIGVSSEYDVQGRNFTLDPLNQNSFATRFSYPLDQTTCRPMKYWISYVYTEDVLGNKGESVRYSNSDFHPFFKFDAGNSDIISLTSAYCTTSIPETNPPAIESYSITSTTNSSHQNEQARVVFQIKDDSDISMDHIPVCFFTGIDNQVISSTSTLIQKISAGTYQYNCDFIFPFTFGAEALLSIYGISDIYYNFIGYSTSGLKSNLPIISPLYNVPSTMSLVIIESTSSLKESPEILYIYGRGFIPEKTIVKVQTDSGSSNEVPSIITGSVIVLVNLVPSHEYTITVTVFVDQTSSLDVKIEGQLTLPSSSDSSLSQSSSQSSSDSNTTPPPTTSPPPSSCKTDCGAPQGYGVCKGTTCICNSPHSGIDCLSTIVKTSIEPNIKKPSVNFTLDNSSSGSSSGGSSTNSKNTQFSSFIALLSINELDQGGNQVVSKHIFNNDKWINIPSDTNNDPDIKTIHYKYIIDNSLSTTIYSTVQVFSQSKLITFGKQQLQMNPSTVKFTFNITAYPFTKSTNTLQLVMSASLLSNQEIGCSYQEFIKEESDSQYLKIQIDQVSLFGRFIGYGIIDGREESITNSAVEHIDEIIQPHEQTSKSQQSYIGLNIRYFKQNALLDPDFSVLLETRSASDQANSICTFNEPSSKLTSAQIAGIVVGSVVFLFIVGAIAIYFLSKKSTNPIIFKLRRLTKH